MASGFRCSSFPLHLPSVYLTLRDPLQEKVEDENKKFISMIAPELAEDASGDVIATETTYSTPPSSFSFSPAIFPEQTDSQSTDILEDV